MAESERNNQWIEQFFRFYIDEDQKNWASYLPLAEFAHNSWRNESMGQTPFEILMGYSPRAEWTTCYESTTRFARLECLQISGVRVFHS
jgi:hypothetical protein